MTHADPNAPGNPSPARRPGCLWYFLAIPIFVVGIYGAMAFMSVVIFNGGSLQSDYVNVPGAEDLFLRIPGQYKIQIHYPYDKQLALVSGDTSSQGDPSDILVSIHSRAIGQLVPLLREAGTDDKPGRAVLTFNVAQKGWVHVTTAYRDGASRGPTSLNIASGFSTGAIAKMTMAGLMLILGLVGPIVFIVYISAKRRYMAPPRKT